MKRLADLFYPPLFAYRPEISRLYCEAVSTTTRYVCATEKGRGDFLAEPPRQQTPTGGRGVSKDKIIAEQPVFPKFLTVPFRTDA